MSLDLDRQLFSEKPGEFSPQPKAKKMFFRFKKIRPFLVWGLIVGVLGFLVWLVYQTWFLKPIFISPLAQGQVLSRSTAFKPSSKEMIGFLPYWSFKKDHPIPWQQLDELIIFSLSVNQKGEIGQDKQDQVGGWSVLKSPKFAVLQAQAQASQTQVGLALTCFDDESINQVLSSQSAQNQFISDLKKITSQYQIDTINIDFEFTSIDQSQKVAQRFANFMSLIKTEFPQKKLSFDVYANMIIHRRPLDVTLLSQSADRMIIMAYDFHRPASQNAGPVAPINRPYGSSRSIIEALEASLEQFPQEKTILGVPLYGYEWQTYSDQVYAQVVPQTAALASFSRVHQLIKDQGLDYFWDPKALSPWLTYQDNNNRTKQIYFENLYSLSLKYQLVKQTNLKGVAYWAVGYEGDYHQVWHQAQDQLKES